VGCGLDSTVSGQGPVAGCCECGDEPSGSCATELVSLLIRPQVVSCGQTDKEHTDTAKLVGALFAITNAHISEC
jgi:hypothetical protein